MSLESKPTQGSAAGEKEFPPRVFPQDYYLKQPEKLRDDKHLGYFSLKRSYLFTTEYLSKEEFDHVVGKLEAGLLHISNGCLVPPDGGSPRIEDYWQTANEALEFLKAYRERK